MKAKKWWIFIAIIIVIIIVVFIFKKIKNGETQEKNTSSENNVTIIIPDNQGENEFIKIEEDGTRVNISEKFSTTKTIEGLEISNIELKEKGNLTQIYADITNTTDKDIEGFYVTITFLDKKGESIVGLGVYIPSVEANGTATLNTNSTGDFANAYDYTITRAEQQ